MTNNRLNLQELYSKTENPGCDGCKILKCTKPAHCIEQSDLVKDAEILFITDSYRYNGWEVALLSQQEQDFFNEKILIPFMHNISYTFTAAVKCISVKDNDMGAKDMNICRKYLEKSIKDANPKLIIPMGNLAMKMLIKKSGIGKNHGSQFEYEGIPVVPTYSTSIIFIEPKYTDVIIQDVKNAISKFIVKSTEKLVLDYTIIENYNQFHEIVERDKLKSTCTPIAFDIEATGLNFLVDKPLTLSISYGTDNGIKSICIPLMHKESKISSKDLEDIMVDLYYIFTNPRSPKVGHNAKFDIKFLKRHYNLEFSNIWDTKTMEHSIDEYSDKGLIDLVKKYMPETLEVL